MVEEISLKDIDDDLLDEIWLEQNRSATKHLQGKHDQSTHAHGGRADSRNYDEIRASGDHMKQASYSDIKSQMAKNLDEIRAEGSIRRKSVSGELTDEAIDNIGYNARAELSAYTNYLAGDTTHLLHTYVNSVEGLLRRGRSEFEGVNAKDLDSLVTDGIRKLIHQEIESNRQQFTDHGIRHLVGNIARQGTILDALSQTSARERLLGMFIMINHDVGYTTPLVRAGGKRGIDASSDHKDFSEKIAGEQAHLWDEGKIFTRTEYDRALKIIKTHDSSSLDTSDSLAFSTRVSDNLALFASEKLPSMFKYVKGGQDLLVQLGSAARSGNDTTWTSTRNRLVESINSSNLSAPLKRDLTASVSEISKLTPKFTLGVLAGEISNISHTSSSVLEVRIQHNSFDSILQQNFDLGQRQVQKLLKDYGITTYDKTRYDLRDTDGKSILSLIIDGV